MITSRKQSECVFIHLPSFFLLMFTLIFIRSLSFTERISHSRCRCFSFANSLSFSSVFVFKPNSIAGLLTLWTFHSFSSMIKFHSQWSVLWRRISLSKIKYYQMLFDSMFIYFYFIMAWCIDICLCHLASCFVLFVHLQFFNIDDINGFQLYCLFILMKLYEYFVLYADWVGETKINRLQDR